MPDAPPILDTHQHLIYSDRWPYSWTAGVPALAGRAFRYDDYLKAIHGTGIAGSLFMDTTPDDPHWRDEARFVYTLPPAIRGVIANCHPESDDFESYMDSIRDARLVGCRRILHVEPDGLSQSPLFAANLRRLGQWNLTFDLCIFPRQIPLAIDLIRRCPHVQFILDHCGNPDIAAGPPGLTAWQNALRPIADLPNVACKISGIVANCPPSPITADLLRPYVEYCLEIFGWDRVVWGSDWPVCQTRCDLSNWVRITRQIVAGSDLADQRKLFQDNAVRIYCSVA